MPSKLEIASLRVSLENIIDEDDKRVARLRQIEIFDKKRINALEHLRRYHNRIKRAYVNKIRPKEFKVDDVVLKENHHKTKTKKDDKRKFDSNCIGPYFFIAKYQNRACKLQIVDGKEDKTLKNIMHLKPFFS